MKNYYSTRNYERHAPNARRARGRAPLVREVSGTSPERRENASPCAGWVGAQGLSAGGKAQGRRTRENPPKKGTTPNQQRANRDHSAEKKTLSTCEREKPRKFVLYVERNEPLQRYINFGGQELVGEFATIRHNRLVPCGVRLVLSQNAVGYNQRLSANERTSALIARMNIGGCALH